MSLQPASPISGRSLALIALLGSKSPYPVLWQLIEQINQQLIDDCGESYQPNTEQAVHATIIGMEAILNHGRILNRNAYNQGKLLEMDLPAALKFLQRDSNLLLVNSPIYFPINIQFGGYQAEQSYGFNPGGLSLFDSSLNIIGEQVVFMGWPEGKDHREQGLAQFRTQMKRFNIYHKYDELDKRDTLHLVLGNLHPSLAHSLTQSKKEHLLYPLRKQLAVKPILLTLTKSDMQWVEYPWQDKTLETGIGTPIQRVTDVQLQRFKQLYEDDRGAREGLS